ncbi:MAG: choloylglycine hydrolase family protein [Sarcina sp.]
MCTSLTLKSLDNKNFLARTMDFALDFNENLNLVPRNFKYFSAADKKNFISKYAALGMSIVVKDHPVFADGVNEKGLSCATLYFPGFAHYKENLSTDKINLAPFDFVYFILANCADIDEAIEFTKQVEFIDVKFDLIGIAPPLHWTLTDKTGRAIVVENTIEGLKITENPLGVMTNSPEIDWHLKNLRQYTGVSPVQENNINWNGLDLNPFSQGAGTLHLPGDYTPPSRFIRAAYLKHVALEPKTEVDAVTALFHILGNCEVPKGAVLKDGKEVDYTLYTSAMCCNTCSYYYKTYDNSQIMAVNMLKEDLNSPNIISYPKPQKQQIDYQN